MIWFRWALVLLAGAVLLVLLAGQLGWLGGPEPSNLGVREGRLKPPSSTPNSVSSQAMLWPGHPQRQAAQIDPIALRGDGATTIARIKAIIEAMPGAELVDAREDYLYARFTSRWLGFVDDTEFWVDPTAQVVQVRSASRVGRRDFGVNRQRIEAIRAALGP